jgi:hypothetical protein
MIKIGPVEIRGAGLFVVFWITIVVAVVLLVIFG